MYYIFYQEYDDMKWFGATSMKLINKYMEKENIARECVMLLKGEMLSDLWDENWPKGQE